MEKYKQLDLNVEESYEILGYNDQNLRIIEQQFNVDINFRNNEIRILNSSVEVENQIYDAFVMLLNLVRKGIKISNRDIIYACYLAKNNQTFNLEKLYEKSIAKTYNGKNIYPKTLTQYNYIQTLKEKSITFGIGAAGTGKTYLACVIAVNFLKNNEVKRIVLTRPAVEAGESLGFLPGDMKEKVDPYLRPLYDALYDMLGVEQVTKLIEKNVIEIAPLAFMRGRTLEDAFIILDEAQNTTDQQMKMFLTRLGFNSKMVITGDISQIDLPRGKNSGLITANNILKDIEEIGFCYFDSKDVVRHPVVMKIIDRFEKI